MGTLDILSPCKKEKMLVQTKDGAIVHLNFYEVCAEIMMKRHYYFVIPRDKADRVNDELDIMDNPQAAAFAEDIMLRCNGHF